jgi:16S rRNA (adenine1518-N6/adenine1519-N6)-dimethyltransferase
VKRPAPSPRPSGAVRRELIELGRRPRKRLGQNFLAHPAIAQRIVALADLQPQARIVEIGPGLGALSDVLVDRAGEAWLIEVDVDLAARLVDRYGDRPHVHIVRADALHVDFAALLGDGPPATVVANLPFNIATAVLARLLAQGQCFRRLVLMVQREVADRLRAQPGTKDYGVLSVLTQCAARVRTGLRVGPEAFVPRPKVEAEVVVVEPLATPPVAIDDLRRFTHVVKTVFLHRRKQLRNSMRALTADPVAVLAAAGIDPARRPETLALAEFAALARALDASLSGTAPAQTDA